MWGEREHGGIWFERAAFARTRRVVSDLENRVGVELQILQALAHRQVWCRRGEQRPCRRRCVGQVGMC